MGTQEEQRVTLGFITFYSYFIGFTAMEITTSSFKHFFIFFTDFKYAYKHFVLCQAFGVFYKTRMGDFNEA